MNSVTGSRTLSKEEIAEVEELLVNLPRIIQELEEGMLRGEKSGETP